MGSSYIATIQTGTYDCDKRTEKRVNFFLQYRGRQSLNAIVFMFDSVVSLVNNKFRRKTQTECFFSCEYHFYSGKIDRSYHWFITYHNCCHFVFFLFPPYRRGLHFQQVFLKSFWTPERTVWTNVHLLCSAFSAISQRNGASYAIEEMDQFFSTST